MTTRPSKNGRPSSPARCARKIAADPALQQRFEVAGAPCLSSTPEEVLAYAAKERKLWKDVVAPSAVWVE
jgi:tripartite-type tricarboxylate transporter receptor subunit TctC